MDELLKQELLFSGLKEISNIGTGNAINELSKILGISVDQLVPKSRIISFMELHEAVENPEDAYVCALADIDGDVDGMICILFKHTEFENLVDIYRRTDEYKEKFAEQRNIDSLEFYTRISDVLSETYLDAIRRFLNVELNRYDINVFTEGLLNILSIPAMKFIGIEENLSITHSTFSFEASDKSEVVGNIVYIPGTTAIEKVMEKLMVM